MLFNSYIFLFAFLPTALIGFHFLRTYRPEWSLGFLTFVSLVFYAWWDVAYLPLLLASIAGNYLLALALWRSQRTVLFTLGIAANLAVLGYYKYAGFAYGLFAAPEAVPAGIREIVLPLAISFFTFEQITFLHGVWTRRIEPVSPGRHALFIALFPHLIAGPIVRYPDLEPQFEAAVRRKPIAVGMLRAGAFLFMIGLAKKVLVADSFAPFADRVFAKAAAGYEMDFLDGWIGALSYTFQLYFDFSGYSDMAVGLAMLFGFRLPINFNSPYQATSITDFWRRWHMSLSIFFRDYVYIPLGGNRHGAWRRAGNLIFVMGLVGLWHGAGLTFLVWGLYHGALLVLSHVVRSVVGIAAIAYSQRYGNAAIHHLPQSLTRAAAMLTTFGFVTVGWVLFRAETFEVAKQIYLGMTRVRAPLEHISYALIDLNLYPIALIMIAAAALVVFVLPNSIAMARTAEQSDLWSAFLSSPRRVGTVGVCIGALLVLTLTSIYRSQAVFIYFNF